MGSRQYQRWPLRFLASRPRCFCFAIVTLAVCAVFAPTVLSQDGQNASVADAARRAREQKKASAKSEKVWTNDNLKAAPATPQPAEPSGAASTREAKPEDVDQEPARAPAESSSPTPAKKPQENTKLKAELSEAKQQLADAEKDLDLLQRDWDLRRDQYYSNPDFRSDKSGKAALDAMEQQITEQRQKVQELKDKVAALEEKIK